MKPESPREGNRVFRRTVFPPGRMPGSTAGKMPATTMEIERFAMRVKLFQHENFRITR
jgi:hypothetical protein